MEARVSAIDWSRTSLGPAGQWPQSLRTALSICLSSRFPMLVWWGPDLLQFYNDAYVPALGNKHPAALGQPAAQCWAEAWTDLGPLAESVLAGGDATYSQDQLLFVQRHGYVEESYWTFSYSPIRDESGGVGGIFIAVNDTTARVLGERRLHALHELGEVSASSAGTADEVCRAAVDVLGRYRTDVPFALVYLRAEDGASARLVATSGVRPGSTVAPLTLPHPERGRSIWRVTCSGDAELATGLDTRYPGSFLPGPIGESFPQDALVLPLSTAGVPEPTGVLVAGTNPYRGLDADYRGFFDLVARQFSTAVTDALAYQAERRRAEALAELDRVKTDFFAGVSHEFRTPLTLIMGPLAELRAAPALATDARLATELAVIHRNAVRLGQLVNTLLEFSRLQAGRIEASYAPVDLATLTAELASVFRSAVERAGLAFTVDCPALHDAVYVDRDMWEKIVLNLLSNAVKYTFDGAITVTVRRRDASVVLAVSDTGSGIPATELPRLFERFHRVEHPRSRSNEGSGIGLAMVAEVVGLHGGTVTAQSEVDVGTTLTVVLPLGSSHLPADRIAVPAAEPPGVTAAEPYITEALSWLPDTDDPPAGAKTVTDPLDAAQGRVLVADDNADMRGYLARLLGARYDVEAVGDGLAALASARARPPDLVVSDVMMPGLGGLALLAALRGEDATARVPVVLLAARAGPEAAVEALAAGADDYLVKPFSAAELTARVGAHLQLGRVRREAEQRFTAMADVVPALIWVAEPDGRRALVNRGWQRFTGRDAAAELGEGWQAGLHPHDRARYLETTSTAMAARRGWEIEFRLRRADGAHHWMLEHAVPIGSDGYNADDRAGYVGACVDINARHRETERQTLLARVGTALDTATGVEQQWDRLARLIVESRLADMCTVRRVDDAGHLHRVATAALEPAVEYALAGLRPDSTLGQRAVRSRRAVLVAELAPYWAEEVRQSADPAEGLTRREVAPRSALAVPLIVRGRVLGVVVLGRRDDAPRYTEDDRGLIEEIAVRAGLALDNALLLADERAAALRLALLQRATAEFSAATTPAQVAAAAVANVNELLGPRRVSVFELDAARRGLVALAVLDADEAARSRWATVDLQAPLPVTVAVREQRPVWLEDVRDATGPDTELVPAMTALGLRAVFALPLVAAGRCVGSLGIGFTEPHPFTPTERSVLLALAEQCGQALDRARLHRAEHRIAETLQRSLLPQQLPELGRLALAARYQPGAEGSQAGGDWYDVIGIDEHRVAVAVGDVVGQGPAAAAGMSRLSSALSGYLLEGHGPAQALELLDRLAARIPGARASTAACVTIDWESGEVHWARAGHPPPLLVTGGSARFLDGDVGHGTVLGVAGRPAYTEGVTTIEPGTTLLLYTDGLVERRGEVIDVGLSRLADIAHRHHADPPELLAAHLLADVVADADQPDDIAMIVARLLPAPLRGSLPALPTALAVLRRRIEEWAKATGLPAAMVDDLQLVLGEAAANAAEHGYRGREPGEFEYLLIGERDGGVRVGVEDFGAWIPAPADRGFRGRGLELIRALGEDVAIDATPSGTTVRFRLPPTHRGDGGHDRSARPPTVRTAPAAVAELHAHAEPDRLRLEILGELDLATADTLGVELLDLLDGAAPGSAVAVDLRGTTFLASAGMGLLQRAVERARHRGIELRVLTTPSGVADRILALTGLGAELPPT